MDFDGREHRNFPIDRPNTEYKQAGYLRHGRRDTYRRRVRAFYLLSQTSGRYLHFPYNIPKSREVAEAYYRGSRETLVLIEKGLPGVLEGCRNGVRNCFWKVALAPGKM